MKKLIYTLLFSLVSLFSFAQTSLITGRVVVDDAIEGQDVIPGILVENEQTHAKILTNENGMFSINASVGDLLNFSNDFYEERSVKVTQEMLKKGVIVVHLNIEVVQLGEANINQLDKNWINNIKNQKSKETTLYENLGLDPSIKDKKSRSKCFFSFKRKWCFRSISVGFYDFWKKKESEATRSIL